MCNGLTSLCGDADGLKNAGLSQFDRTLSHTHYPDHLMKIALAGLIVFTSPLSAQWLVLKPTEFEPLTSLPWEQPDATLEKVLGAIFREPNSSIRYRLLGEYLWQVPEEEMGKAFDLCVPLEGTQNPDELVARFIPIWVERDPLASWNWVKKLFSVVGIENGVLGYDSWKLPRITVYNLDAIRASPFWIEPDALQSFPVFVNRSKLPKGERIQVMKGFAEMWFNAFGSWPGYWPTQGAKFYFQPRESGDQRAVISMFRDPIAPDPLNQVLTWIDRSSPVVELLREIKLRRMLKAEPASGPEIVKVVA